VRITGAGREARQLAVIKQQDDAARGRATKIFSKNSSFSVKSGRSMDEIAAASKRWRLKKAARGKRRPAKKQAKRLEAGG